MMITVKLINVRKDLWWTIFFKESKTQNKYNKQISFL
jgi:hypothetical protein